LRNGKRVSRSNLSPVASLYVNGCTVHPRAALKLASRGELVCSACGTVVERTVKPLSASTEVYERGPTNQAVFRANLGSTSKKNPLKPGPEPMHLNALRGAHQAVRYLATGECPECKKEVTIENAKVNWQKATFPASGRSGFDDSERRMKTCPKCKNQVPVHVYNGTATCEKCGGDLGRYVLSVLPSDPNLAFWTGLRHLQA
jgi:hypothetical protein